MLKMKRAKSWSIQKTHILICSFHSYKILLCLIWKKADWARVLIIKMIKLFSHLKNREKCTTKHHLMNTDAFIKHTFWSLNCGSNGKLFPKHKQLFLQLDSIFEPLYMNIRDVNVYVFLLDIFYYIYTFVSIYNPQVSCASSIYIFYLNGFLQFCDYQTMVRC